MDIPYIFSRCRVVGVIALMEVLCRFAWLYLCMCVLFVSLLLLAYYWPLAVECVNK
jgi:hypothetical protein